jgi:hypothetical protein
MTTEEAKAVLTIPILWARLGLRGDCRKNPCKSPFREDKHASFSVFNEGRAFNDLGGFGGGDAVDFLRLATGLSPEAAFTKFLEMAGGGVAIAALPKREHTPKETQPRQKPVFPAFEHGTEADLHALAALRKISFAACWLARSVGLLNFGTWKDKPSWIVTDRERLNAQARRMDGQPWEAIGAKAQTLPGSWASWPLGIITGANYPAFLLVEGGPDLLAALHFIHAAGAETLVFPLALLGASMAIHEDALPLLANKRIRIFPHADPAGTKAANRWAAQLATVGAIVDCADFSGLRKADGSPIKDLNDCTSIHPADAHELFNLLPL